jgi:hypothetical protein
MKKGMSDDRNKNGKDEASGELNRLFRTNPTYFQGFICRSVAVNEGAEGQRENTGFYEVHRDLAWC